jgi:isochorismate synthase
MLTTVSYPAFLAARTTPTWQHLWRTAIELGYSVALWQMPQSSEWHLLIHFSAQPQMRFVDTQEMPFGFVVAPFAQDEADKKAYFLEADLYFDSAQEQYSQNSKHQEHIALFWQTYQDNHSHTASKATSRPTPYHISPTPTKELSKAHFQSRVQKAVQLMREPKPLFDKVVLSRTKKVELESGFDLWQTFGEAAGKYPNAFVSLVSSPLFGTWFCATPEILVSQDKQGIFRTIALAGTQAFQPNVRLCDVLWRQKEIEEQALVSRYIINCFKKIRLREYEEIGPRTAVAGNLMHLRTDFLVDTQEQHFPQLATVMLELLHPTSAVCGMPKQTAQAFIQQNEDYDRKLYSGYVGTVNDQQQTNLFVLLRCMELFEQQAYLYAGAGITADSEPEKEWHETEIKCQTLSSLLQNLSH